ncbi:Hypothetical protein HDN1F_25710 [gamma proteobacterium HdN1]|nr:Hypothetical protein HDN1F_25710 [gamma proteobacterium HdN1]
MKRFFLVATLTATSILTVGCTWVKPTTGGERVVVVTPEQANLCEKLGQTRVTTQSKVGIFARNDSKVDEELVTMARNSAADMGGNAILPLTRPSPEGRQTFAILRCDGF